MAWPIAPELAGKRVTRAEVTADALSVAFADGTKLTFEPTRDERGVNVSDAFTPGEPADVLAPGATIRRARWMLHDDVPDPWGVRFDLDDDRSVYVFRFKDRLQVTDRLKRAVRGDMKTDRWSPWNDFVARMVALAGAITVTAVAEHFDLPDPMPSILGAFVVGVIAFGIFLVIALGVSGYLGQRRANRRARVS